MTLTKDDDEFGTPLEFFEKLDREFNFTIDVAASAINAKLERYYTKEDDGLSKAWTQERVFCNPPYSKGNTVPWIYKAFQETYQGDCILAVLLVPGSRCEQEWFQDVVRHYAGHRHIRGRIKFDGGHTTGLKPSMLCIFRNSKYLVW